MTGFDASFYWHRVLSLNHFRVSSPSPFWSVLRKSEYIYRYMWHMPWMQFIICLSKCFTWESNEYIIIWQRSSVSLLERKCCVQKDLYTSWAPHWSWNFGLSKQVVFGEMKETSARKVVPQDQWFLMAVVQVSLYPVKVQMQSYL